MLGGDKDKFATGQAAAGAAGASMGSFGSSAANKAAKVTGGYVSDSGDSFSGPVAGQGEFDVQRAAFGKGYTDLARGLARSLGQDKWANRDNLQNQQNQAQAFLNQVIATGKSNVVTGGFSTDGMNITQNALAVGGKGAGSAAANDTMPIGLKGQTQQDLSSRVMSNVSPYLSRAQALADASGKNQLERALSSQPKWSQQVEETYRSQYAFDESFAQRGSKYPVMNRDVRATGRGFTGTQTQEKPTYADVPPNQTGNLNYQSPYSQELWVDSIDPTTGHFDAQKFLNPVTTPSLNLGESRDLRNEGLPSRNIASELQEESRSGQADEMNIHQRNWAADPQGKPDIPNAVNAEVKRQMAQDAVKMRVQQQQKGGGFGDLDGRTPGIPQMLKEELAKLDNAEFARQQYQQWAKQREASIWEPYDIPKNPPWGVPMNGDFDALGGRGPVDFNQLGRVKTGGGANRADHPLRQLLKQAEQGADAQKGLEGKDQSSNQDVIAIPSEDPDGGRFGKGFGEVMGTIGDYAAGRQKITPPTGRVDLSLVAKTPVGRVGDLPPAGSFGTIAGGFLKSLFDTYMGGLSPGNATTDPMTIVRRWMSGARVNPNVDPLVEANLIRAAIDKANSLQKAESSLGGMLPFRLPNGQIVSKINVVDRHGGEVFNPAKAITSGMLKQQIDGTSASGTAIPHTSRVNDTAQSFFLTALKQYQQSQKAAGVPSGAKAVRIQNSGDIKNGPGRMGTILADDDKYKSRGSSINIPANWIGT